MELQKIITDLEKPVQAQTELRRCVNGDEQNFVSALYGEKIKTEPIERIKELLRLLFMKIGLRATNLPTPEETAVLIAHIVTEYGNHSLEEVKLAFDMGIAGKLDFEDNAGIICYENFSCLYFSGVMNAYRKWSKDAYKQTKMETPIMIEEKKELTKWEKLRWIVEVKQKQNLSFNDIPVCFYDYLNFHEDAFYDKMQESIAYTRSCIADENELFNIKKAKLDEFNKQVTRGYFTGELLSRVMNNAKKMLVFEKLTF